MIAPWKDYNGKDIKIGDTIMHPCGEQGLVIFLQDKESPSDAWMVKYDNCDYLMRLCLQLGEKGQAVVV